MSPLPQETYVTQQGLYSAQILADSISSGDVRLTTIEARFPRFILAEVNTHRVFSRNSASSRAIPVHKNVKNLRLAPFVPETFGKRVPGMGVGEILGTEDMKRARDIWLETMEHSIDGAERLTAPDLDVDKSRANRLLEPFMWHTAIITSTEWANFFALRCPDGEEIDFNFGAQPEFQQTAILMRRAMQNSKPVNLRPGEWHAPLIEWDKAMEEDLKVFGTGRTKDAEQRVLSLSARRLARVSFDKHTDDEEYSVSISKAGTLVASAHFSPTEHIARPLESKDTTDPKIMPLLRMSVDKAREYRFVPSEMWCGNLRGWFQWRKQFPYEDNHRLALEAS